MKNYIKGSRFRKGIGTRTELGVTGPNGGRGVLEVQEPGYCNQVRVPELSAESRGGQSKGYRDQALIQEKSASTPETGAVGGARTKRRYRDRVRGAEGWRGGGWGPGTKGGHKERARILERLKLGYQARIQGKSEGTRRAGAEVLRPSRDRTWVPKCLERGYWDQARVLVEKGTGGQAPGTRGGGAGVLEASGASRADSLRPGRAAGTVSPVPVPCVQRQKMVSDSPGLLLVPHTSSSSSLVTSDMMGTGQEGLCFPDSGPGT